jgi:cytochrome c oxidase subunit I+III
MMSGRARALSPAEIDAALTTAAHRRTGVMLVATCGAIFAALVLVYCGLMNPDLHRQGSLPPLQWPIAAAASALASSVLVAVASRALGATPGAPASFRAAVTFALVFLAGAFALDLGANLRAGLAPAWDAYHASVAAILAYQGFLLLVLTVMTGCVLALSWEELLDERRRVSLDNCALLWHYVVAQELAALALIHGVPRLAV